MANPNFRPIYVPLALYDQIERMRWQIALWRLQHKRNPRVPLHRVIEVAIEKTKLQEELDTKAPKLPSLE